MPFGAGRPAHYELHRNEAFGDERPREMAAGAARRHRIRLTGTLRSPATYEAARAVSANNGANGPARTSLARGIWIERSLQQRHDRRAGVQDARRRAAGILEVPLGWLLALRDQRNRDDRASQRRLRNSVTDVDGRAR